MTSIERSGERKEGLVSTSAGGRPSNFTPEQDAVILGVSSSEEVNRRFVAMGYSPVNPDAIIRRRAYLKSQGFRPRTDPPEQLERSAAKLLQRLEALDAERERLRHRLRLVEQERDLVQANLDEVLRERGYVPTQSGD